MTNKIAIPLLGTTSFHTSSMSSCPALPRQSLAVEFQRRPTAATHEGICARALDVRVRSYSSISLLDHSVDKMNPDAPDWSGDWGHVVGPVTAVGRVPCLHVRIVKQNDILSQR